MPILLVDDDSEDLELYELVFRELGHTKFLKATGGCEALRLLEEGFMPGLIVSDLNMPKLDGFELIKEINARFQPGIPIVILTTTSRPEQHQRAIDAGALACFVKPSGYHELKELLKMLYETYYEPAGHRSAMPDNYLPEGA